MNAAIRAAAAQFPALTEAELVALWTWKRSYQLRSQGHSPSQAVALARLMFEWQTDQVTPDAPAASPPAPKKPTRPRAALVCAYGLLALAYVLLVLTTMQG